MLDLKPFLNRKRWSGFRREQEALQEKWGQEIDSDPFYDSRFLRKRRGIATFLRSPIH